MFLKRLDISGFKSFADKTSVTFVPGVTAVVGPNGSGKSNITEAIRWVLGEQSAKSLRGSKMEDIIFSGSDARKAVNMAEVTLTLDNRDQYIPLDYSEIVVTRRVFRSGESEFMLNRQNCRLKDIVDLFMDSGLGKEAYSVIGQGKIDEILNSKSEDKRKIFEEAAGVLKYKLRKQAAAKKLVDSEDNLNRVEDILHELKNRLDPLEKQASVAKDYLAKKAELKQVDVALLVYDIDRIHHSWTEKKKRVQDLNRRKSELEKTLHETEERFQTMRERLDHFDQSIDECQSKLAEAGENLEKILGRQHVLKERKRHTEGSSQDLKERIEQLTRQLKEEQEQYKKAETVFLEERAKMQRLNKSLKEKQTKYTDFDQNLDEQIEKVKAEYIDVLNQQASMRNETRYLNDQHASISHKRSLTDEQIHAASKRVQEAESGRQLAERKLKEATAEGDLLRKALDDADSALEQQHNRYTKQKHALEKITRFIDQAESKKEMLEALKEDYAGFYQGVRMVLKNRHRLQGISGAVAELIRVDQAYQTAIEVALGGSSQSVVVADEASGRRAIHFLRKNQAGRATFLPLSVMRPRFLPVNERRQLEKRSGFIGTADELVTCDAKYLTVIRHLLGSVIIAETLEQANQLAHVMGYKFRIVTLAGDVVSPGGAMTGGSRKKNGSGLIGRNSEIETIKNQLREMRTKVRELKAQFSELKNTLSSDELKRGKLADSLKKNDEKMQNLRSHLFEAGAEEKSSRDNYQLLTREHGDYAAEENKINARLNEIKRITAENEEKEQALTARINQLTETSHHRTSARSALEKEITALKVETASQNQIVIHQQETVKQMKAHVEELTASIDALRSSAEGVDADLSDQVLSEEKLRMEAERSKREKEHLAALLKERKAKRTADHSEIAGLESEMKRDRGKYDHLTQAFQNEKVALERLDVQLDHLLDALREDYEMTIDRARENYRLKIDPEDARKKVKLIKRAIDELGTINVGAIEEYDHVLERYQFLTNQRNDLLKARETLEHVMTEMDREVARRFSETFTKIRSQFQMVFQELFGGGRADLKLIDPNDLLESGIEIFAEPPGKKLQRLSLLSGGERALTAIALLFAILKIRPVPFCVLDEVEAALDDANVDRYAEFLKNFSSETQFIVVTHRHGTMEHADVLYGVTMQESGISKLVSVRLEKTDELLQTGG
ncbi:chromosome segregation protein SMC [Sporolactobacillus sp. THM19-2]|uniref:chromosome segregation protein SMC n=1 Tax=Sporolactobacillus sp. THM19-2 TaxID=2511171 RepID=UPI00101F2CD6|nr:chromosome segregation protein SMC [Sporolactobacillus sp. THM19-2]RYL92925.1 chromosome segregation protein SMC [Sporolactobacillus sp. THM19-2]